jgi:imidazolonepropionase-like amidohydrolase
MKKIISSIVLGGFFLAAAAQESVLPSPPQKGIIFIKNATIHVGNGTVINNGSIQIRDGKIEKVGADIPMPQGNVKVIDAAGKQVYPGVILPVSNLGLVEISSIRASADVREIGDMNPNVRSIVAYNTDSKVINTLRSQGVLMANVVPQGSFLAGSSSVVQLDAWNYQDAAVKTDVGMHLYMPSLMPRPDFGRFGGGGGRFGPQQSSGTDPVKEGLAKIEELKSFFLQAKAYLAEPTHKETNLKFESVKGLFDKTQKFYVHANTVRQMLVAIDFVKQFNFDVVIVGGSDSWQIADLLKQNNVSVVLSQMHSLPTSTDDDVDQPYKSAAALQKAGVVFSISDDDPQTRGKNILFNAGTAAAYGLTKEQALQAITLNAAKIMGVEDKAGSIEVGKDANIVISEGDILDMKSSKVTDALIQGREVDLTDKHKLLNDRFNKKYDLKKTTAPPKPF